MLSRYKILERIGSGGVGIVHEAEDLKLRRSVAIKLLSEESFARDHTRARFDREARLAASLNHPNICTIHEVGEADAADEMVLEGNPRIQAGTPFLVMELVRGRSLDAVLREDGPLPLTRLLEIVVQVAEGLTEAHAKSIVHRDLKPRNVMVTPEGRAKILDFGMAKPLVPADRDDVRMRTTEDVSIELTREGMVFGTVAYMSPEQASGRAVDSRSDVFAFGIMLYEMAVGRKPFEGESVTSTLAKILETEPQSIAELRDDLPLELSRIIHRCLRKNPDDRYNDTRDLAVALRDLLHETSSGAFRRADAAGTAPAAAPVAVARSRSRAVPLAAIGLLAVVALASVLLVPRMLRSSPRFLPPSFEQVTFTGSASFPSLAPDGRSLAYATIGPGGGYQVVVQDLAGGQQLPILEAEWIRSLRWSPGGSELIVSAGGADGTSQTHLVSRLGGSTRPLRYFPFVAWSPDGSRFAGATLSGKRIWFTETATAGTSAIDLTGSFTYVYEIDWSPGGESLLFLTSDASDRHAIWTTTVDGARQQVLVEGAEALSAPRFSGDGGSVYYLSGTAHSKELRRVDVDPRTGEPRGEPVVLLSGLQAGSQLEFSRDGRSLLYTREVSHANLWLVERQGEGLTSRPLTRGTFLHDAPRFSSDGERIALVRRSRSSPNVFVLSLADGRTEQLTYLTEETWQPVWSPDDREIAFASTMGDVPRVWKVDARGGTPMPFTNTDLSRDLTWAPGSRIIYQQPGDSSFRLLDPAGGDETAFMGDADADAADPLQFFSWMASPRYAPDGRRVAVRCNCPGGDGIWTASIDGSKRRLIHRGTGALPVGWSAAGDWVYALEPGSKNLLRISAGDGTVEIHATLPFEHVGAVDVTPDGKRIAAAVPVTQADIWRIENFDPAAGP